jgi:hypothetical protein
LEITDAGEHVEPCYNKAAQRIDAAGLSKGDEV